MVEHVFGGFAQIDDPFAQVRRFDLNAIFWLHRARAWLSPQMPQMRLVMKWASRGSLPFMKML